MEPFFAFVVCAQTCLIQAPRSGMSREQCLYRMEVALAEKPKQRVLCMTRHPVGEVIDSAGLYRTEGPAAYYRATMLTQNRLAIGAERVEEQVISTVRECEDLATRSMAAAMQRDQAYAVSIECLPHYSIAPGSPGQ